MTRNRASPDSWETQPLPEPRAQLGFEREFTNEEFEALQLGFVPEHMEERWFVLWQEPWLTLYRSWTGYAVFGLRIEPLTRGAFVAESWVSRDRNQYKGDDLLYDREVLSNVLNFVINCEERE